MQRLALTLILLFATAAHSEEFFGVEKGSDPQAQDAAQSDSTTEQSTDTSSGTWSGSGALWPDVHRFSGVITLSYHFNPYVGIDTHGYYSRFTSKKTSDIRYGPETNFVVRLTNPTMLTPLAGTGIGYDRWARTYDGELFDDAGSVAVNAFIGLQINLTQHFVLQGMRKQKIYLADAPISLEDRRTQEPKSRLTNRVGFLFVF